MSRDSLYGERILWSGRPKLLSTPPLYRYVAVACAATAVVSFLFATVVAVSLQADVTQMLLFGGFCATVALLSWRLPKVWQAGVEYLVTERHVIWRRGAIRRSIDRSAISYARIVWATGEDGVGDLVLVRAVPTGALKRTLSLTLGGVEAPDRLWSLVRGQEPAKSLGLGSRPLAQRLDDGERVLWSGIPKSSRWTPRRVLLSIVSVLLVASAVLSTARAVPPMLRVIRLHVLGGALSAAFVGGIAIGALLVFAAAALTFWYAVVRPRHLAQSTRYFVTDRRVLIRRGPEELSLDRSRIAYVIATGPAADSDVFLVLDGPQARALSPSGAFGESPERDSLLPVLSGIDDADGAVEILKEAA